jgi:hypothetical protein
MRQSNSAFAASFQLYTRHDAAGALNLFGRAFALLAKLSQDTNIAVRIVAERLVDPLTGSEVGVPRPVNDDR